MSRYYKATEVDELFNKVGKGNCNLCAFYDECKWCKDETPNADDFCSYGERKDENA